MLIFITLSMLFLHIIADFNLQGIMGDLKQKAWWQKNYPNKKYKNDYIFVLTLHSFSWSFLVMLPIAIYRSFNVDYIFLLVLLFNIVVHSIVDDLKANKLSINLIEDQLIHIAQITLTALILLAR